jgi:hypothetical protein
MAKRATTKKKTKKAVSAKPSAKGAAGRKARRAATQGKNIAKSVGMRARKSAMSTAQKQAGGKGISEGKAATREAGRGKVGPKRNVIKTKSGILRDKSGKAVKRLSREELAKRRKANK